MYGHINNSNSNDNSDNDNNHDGDNKNKNRRRRSALDTGAALPLGNICVCIKIGNLLFERVDVVYISNDDA